MLAFGKNISEFFCLSAIEVFELRFLVNSPLTISFSYLQNTLVAKNFITVSEKLQSIS